MISTQEKCLLKLELDESDITRDGYEEENITDLQGIEFEMITPVDFSDKRQVEIYNGITEVDERLAVINQKVEELNTEIDRLTNHADVLDYTIAVASGIIAGAIDIFYVDEFSRDRGKEWSNEKVNNFVMKVAKKNGFDLEAYRGQNPLKGAIKFLEDKYHIPSDGVWNSSNYGINGISHHLDDWAHHPSLLGLICSILTQFTHKSYFSNKDGKNIKMDVPISLQRIRNGKTETVMLIGNTISSKFYCGVINWAMHLVSDMAGSSKCAGAGMGIPGPIMTLLKEISAIPGINKTCLPQKVGEFFENNRFDLREEMGIGHEIGRQAIPVVVNEALVRGFYFLRRLIQQLKEKKSFKNIDWKKTLPFKNRTIVRMLTIATGTFTAIDLADAGIRAVINNGGFNPKTLVDFILRVNFVGIGRFAIAVGTDIGMGMKKGKKENERILLLGQELNLLNAKIFYKEANMWISAEKTGKTLNEIFVMVEETAQLSVKSWNQNIKDINTITPEMVTKIKQKNSGLIEDVLKILD